MQKQNKQNNKLGKRLLQSAAGPTILHAY